MPSAPLSGKSSLAGDPTDLAAPLLPTVVVASYKGGVWKTTLAVALAERLAWAGLRVLLVTCDDQEDARSRLGVTASDPQVARQARGEGSITVLGARDNKAIDLLYRRGPEKLGLGTYDLAVVDTPPQIKGGTLPGVLLIATVDGTDAARNLISMLKQTPKSSKIVLVKVKRDDPDAWAQNADAIGTAAKRDVTWLPSTLPQELAIPVTSPGGLALMAALLALLGAAAPRLHPRVSERLRHPRLPHLVEGPPEGGVAPHALARQDVHPRPRLGPGRR